MNDEQYLKQLEDDMYDTVDENFEQVPDFELNKVQVSTGKPYANIFNPMNKYKLVGKY